MAEDTQDPKEADQLPPNLEFFKLFRQVERGVSLVLQTKREICSWQVESLVESILDTFFNMWFWWHVCVLLREFHFALLDFPFCVGCSRDDKNGNNNNNDDTNNHDHSDTNDDNDT